MAVFNLRHSHVTSITAQHKTRRPRFARSHQRRPPHQPMKLAATAAFGLSPTLCRPVSSRFPSPLPLHLRAAAWTLATAVCSLFYVGPAMLLLPPFLALWSPRAAAALLLVDLALAFAPAREWAGFRSVFQLWCGVVSRRLTRLNATSFGGQAVTNSCASRVPRYEIFDVRTNLPQDGARAVGATLRAHCVLRRVFASLTHSEVLCARARACLRASRAPPLTRRSRRPLSPSAPPPSRALLPAHMERRYILAMSPHGVIPFQGFIWPALCDQYMRAMYGFGATTDFALRVPLLRQVLSLCTLRTARIFCLVCSHSCLANNIAPGPRLADGGLRAGVQYTYIYYIYIYLTYIHIYYKCILYIYMY